MENLRFRPKNNFINEAKWEELYVLTEYWLSELKFFKDEIKFLEDIINKYFIWLTKEENIDKVREQIVVLTKLHKEVDELIDRTKKHLNHIAELLTNPFAYDEYKFREEHAVLEEDFTKAFKAYKNAKKEIFKITEHVMDTEKLQHLLED
jgi:CRISPR/Cas system CMR subunit Cmr4 (Cas7 group RAMP superfamily)